MKAKSFHVARSELEKALPLAPTPSVRNEILTLLSEAAFSDQEYERSFHWANTLLTEDSLGDEEGNVLYIRGVSAFQTGRLDIALTSINALLNTAAVFPYKGRVYYWRALCELERNDRQAAEESFKHCLEDPAAADYHDRALMNQSLFFVQQGRLEEATSSLRRLMSDYPRSDFYTDAQLLLSSVLLRQDNAKDALPVLEGARPHYSSQREQLLLLRSQAEFAMAEYGRSSVDFKDFLYRYPESQDVRTARLGLAWSLFNEGNINDAQKEFEILSTGNDTVASAALYQLGMIVLLKGRTPDAMNYFTSLTENFPYDTYADRSYYQIGMIHYRGQHYREARRNFQYVTQLFPQSTLRADAYRMSGESSVALGDFSNAEYAFSQTQHYSTSAELLAPSMFQEGICLYHLGRFKSSVERFDEFLSKFQSDEHAPQAYIWRGEALYQDYRFDEAERSLMEGLRRFPRNPKREDAEYSLAWALFQQKKFLQAADAFDRYVANYPQSERRLDASLRKADCYFFLGRYDKASDMYASLAAEKNSNQKSEYAAFQLAMSYIQRGESQRGIEQLQNFLARFPSSLYCEVARFNIGWTHFSNEQFSEAIGEFKLLQRQYPQSQLMPRVLFNMGDAFYNLKVYDSARVYYQRVIDEYSASPLAADALTGLQFTYQAQGKSPEALATIEKYLNAKPSGLSTEELMLRKGDLLFGQNDFSGAIQEYQHVLSLKPSPAVRGKALHQLGRSYELQNNLPRAVGYYEQAIADRSDSEEIPAITLALGIDYIKLKQDRFAVGTLQGFAEKFPDSPLLAEARYNLGLALMSGADNETALQQFQLIIQYYPADIFADRSRLQIAKLLYRKKEYQHSIDTLNRVIEHRGDDVAAEALLSLGENYVAMKRFKDALQSYHDVIVQYKDFPLLVEQAHLGTGGCYEKLHDRENARKAYQEILKSPVDPAIKSEADKRLKRLHR